jgi:DNA-directed RNA polymerase specialized sigma24 family protein
VDQIAGVLGVPGGTVKSRLFHARAALRKVLPED